MQITSYCHHCPQSSKNLWLPPDACCLSAWRQDKQWAYDHIYDANITANISFNPDPNYNDVLSQYDTAHELGFIKGNPRPLSSFFDISVYADALQETIKENPNEEFYKKMWTYFVEHNNRHPDFKEKYSKIL